jgi:hypothetical protein
MADLVRTIASNMGKAITFAFPRGKKSSQAVTDIEEGIDSYYQGGFHPVHIGDIIGRYRVLRKLGHGQYSTVWLVRNPE